MSSKSVALIHNIPSPYRLPIFEEFSKHCDLTVYFCTSNHEDRYWEPDLDKYSFSHRFLHSRQIGPLYISLTILMKLIVNQPDKIIISENPPILPITLVSLVCGKIMGAEIIIWNEAWNEDISPHLDICGPAIIQYIVERMISSVIRGYRQFIYQIADEFIAFSEMAGEYLESLGVDNQNIIVSQQVMPATEIPEPTHSEHISNLFSNNKTSILYLGYFRPSKGIEILLEAFEKIVGDHDVELIIAGKGQEEYEKKIRRIGSNIKNVKFAGYVDNEKSDCYINADVFVLPTYRDAWGLVINESLYNGTPVITTESAAGKSIIEQNGLILPSGDTTALQYALILCTIDPFLETITPDKIRRDQVSDPSTMAQALYKACSQST